MTGLVRQPMKITRTLHHRWFSTTSAKLAAGLLLHCAGLAQSTTDWIPVGPPASGGLARNSTYVTVTLEHGRLNAKANWWTKLIGTQKKAVVTASIYADYGTGATPFEDKRSSASFDVKKYDSPVDLAWKQSLAVNLPATFRLLRVSVSFATSAKDGADELLKVAGDISSKVPNPTPSQNIIGFVSVAKSLIDYLVGNQLLKEQLKSTGELITTATQPMTPGYYVVFAGNSAEDYAKYTENKEGLSWDHAVLRLGTNVVSDVSYFILKLDYLDFVKIHRAFWQGCLYIGAAMTNRHNLL